MQSKWNKEHFIQDDFHLNTVWNFIPSKQFGKKQQFTRIFNKVRFAFQKKITQNSSCAWHFLHNQDECLLIININNLTVSKKVNYYFACKNLVFYTLVVCMYKKFDFVKKRIDKIKRNKKIWHSKFQIKFYEKRVSKQCYHFF